MVLDAASGDLRFAFGTAGSGPDELSVATSLCVHGDHVFVADTDNHRIQVYKHTDGTHVRSIGRAGQAPDGSRAGWPYEHDERRSSAPGEFNRPVGVAIGHGRLIVSEDDGKRIQVLTLEGEPLQILKSPEKDELGGLCVDGDRLWATGPTKDPANVYLYKFIT